MRVRSADDGLEHVDIGQAEVLRRFLNGAAAVGEVLERAVVTFSIVLAGDDAELESVYILLSSGGRAATSGAARGPAVGKTLVVTGVGSKFAVQVELDGVVTLGANVAGANLASHHLLEARVLGDFKGKWEVRTVGTRVDARLEHHASRSWIAGGYGE